MMSQILVKPILTEKTSKLTEDLNRYVFEVKKTANKIEIRKAVEKTYNVNVTSVNTMRYAGKKKVRATRNSYSIGRTNAFKKAIISVADGEAIDLYDNI
jgi:large subunit ribosomal protein L23